MWQLLAMWLWAHPPTASFAVTLQPAKLVKLVNVASEGQELFYVDKGGRLHLVEHDPAVIACACEYRDMTARLCDACHREVMFGMLCVPVAIEPEVSRLVNEIQN